MEEEQRALLGHLSQEQRRPGIEGWVRDGLRRSLAAAGRLHAGLAANQELYGLWLAVWSTVWSTGMSLAAKIAGQQGVPVFQVVLVRSLFLVGFTAPELIATAHNPFSSNRQWLLLLRGALGFCSVSSLYWAVSLLPMAEAQVLSFLAPVFVAALSPLALRERPSRGVLLALPCCLAGVLLVARPAALFGAGAAGAPALGVVIGLVQAFFSAAAKMCVRALSAGGEEPLAAVVFSMGAVSTVGATLACAALRAFVLPASPLAWLALLANGLFGYWNQVCLTGALQRTKAASAIAMSYCSILWGMLADLLIFHAPPAALSLLGAAVICGSSLGVAWAEKRAQAARRAAAASPVPDRAPGVKQAGAVGTKGGGYELLAGGDEEEGAAGAVGHSMYSAGKGGTASVQLVPAGGGPEVPR